jgi:hypothetical protein
MCFNLKSLWSLWSFLTDPAWGIRSCWELSWRCLHLTKPQAQSNTVMWQWLRVDSTWIFPEMQKQVYVLLWAIDDTPGHIGGTWENPGVIHKSVDFEVHIYGHWTKLSPIGCGLETERPISRLEKHLGRSIPVLKKAPYWREEKEEESQ